MLGSIFGANTAFSAASPSPAPAGVTRNYGSLSEAANEALVSRIYGGIHYKFSTVAGLAVDDDVGKLVLAKFDASAPDTAGPSVRVDPPPAGATSKATPTLLSRVSDNLSGVASLTASVDGRAAAPGAFDGNGAVTLPLAALVTSNIIFNAFRLPPAELFFAEAQRHNVGILARVPLASGLLTGTIARDTQFARDDHRNFNRHGKAFDVGETFSGLEDLDAALAAVEEVRALVPTGVSMAAFALRRILMHEAVSCAIPGAKRADQVDDNVSASDLSALSEGQMKAIEAIYDRHVRRQVHQRW